LSPPIRDDVIARWSARKSLYGTAVFLGIVFVLLVLALLDPANDTPKPFGLVALVLIASLALGLIQMAARSAVVLTPTELRIRRRHGSTGSIRLDEVSGVAVVRALPGWAIFIWAGDGPPIRLPSPERVFILKAQARAPADAAYWSHVADSPAGTAAQQIYQQARIAQGSASALSRLDVAALVARDRRLFHGVDTRWWSPSGEHGIAQWAR
jgi:hypothetical protein